jgi:hypothetical protein
MEAGEGMASFPPELSRGTKREKTLIMCCKEENPVRSVALQVP